METREKRYDLKKILIFEIIKNIYMKEKSIVDDLRDSSWSGDAENKLN